MITHLAPSGLLVFLLQHLPCLPSEMILDTESQMEGRFHFEFLYCGIEIEAYIAIVNQIVKKIFWILWLLILLVRTQLVFP